MQKQQRSGVSRSSKFFASLQGVELGLPRKGDLHAETTQRDTHNSTYGPCHPSATGGQ